MFWGTYSLGWAPGFDILVLTKGPHSLLFWGTGTFLTGCLAFGCGDEVACLDVLTLHAVDSLQSPSFKHHSLLYLDTALRETPVFCSNCTRLPPTYQLKSLLSGILLSFWSTLWFSSLVMVEIIIREIIIISVYHCFRQGSLSANNRNPYKIA